MDKQPIDIQQEILVNSDRIRAYTILLLMPLMFALNPVIGRATVMTVTPWTLADLRWTLASAILLPFAWSGLRRHASQLLSAFHVIAALGLLGVWIGGGIVYSSLQSTTASNGLLIYMAAPVIVILLDALINREPLSLLRSLGVTLAFLGVASIVLRGNIDTLRTLKFNSGDLAMVFAAISWALYSLLLKHKALRGLPPLPLFCSISLAGTAMLTPMMLWETLTSGGWPSDLKTWTSIAGLALIPSVLAFSAYQYGIAKVGASITSVFLYLMAPYGVILAVIFLGEPFQFYHGIGLALIILGIVLATRTQAPDPKAPS
ncbi:MAG TPA: DMT family transporter [Xanthobacteraceae bacterium]|jgi:drug/metabolite transporter (DMT)-like permease|nr:DMT family transporter [Xanthobacteraceae bacterium]